MRSGEAWYKQPRSQRDRKELAEDFRVPQPPYELILSHLAAFDGRATETLRMWIRLAGYDIRRKDDFVKGLLKNAERGGNESLAVEPFDSELAMKPLALSGELPITIRSDAILASMEKTGKEALRKRKRRGGKTGGNTDAASRRRRCGVCDEAKTQGEIEDSSGIAVDCPAEIPRVRKDKSIIFSKEKDNTCADACGVEAPPLSAEEDRYAKRLKNMEGRT